MTQDQAFVQGPPYELNGAYPGTCVRLPPLRWWPVSLVLALVGWPSISMLTGMLRWAADPQQTSVARGFQVLGLLVYAAWHAPFNWCIFFRQ